MKINVGCFVKIKKYPEYGVFRVVGYNPALDYWELGGFNDYFSDSDLIVVREP